MSSEIILKSCSYVKSFCCRLTCNLEAGGWFQILLAGVGLKFNSRRKLVENPIKVKHTILSFLRWKWDHRLITQQCIFSFSMYKAVVTELLVGCQEHRLKAQAILIQLWFCLASVVAVPFASTRWHQRAKLRLRLGPHQPWRRTQLAQKKLCQWCKLRHAASGHGDFTPPLEKSASGFWHEYPIRMTCTNREV